MMTTVHDHEAANEEREFWEHARASTSPVYWAKLRIKGLRHRMRMRRKGIRLKRLGPGDYGY